MDQTLNELNENFMELQTIINNISNMPLEKIGKGDKIRLITINEYIIQALLYARNLNH
jgi:hypothetical protein